MTGSGEKTGSGAVSVADALAEVNRVQAETDTNWSRSADEAELAALRDLAEAVRATLDRSADASSGDTGVDTDVIETGDSRTLSQIGRDVCRSARAARDWDTLTYLASQGLPIAAVVPVAAAGYWLKSCGPLPLKAAAGKYLARWRVAGESGFRRLEYNQRGMAVNALKNAIAEGRVDRAQVVDDEGRTLFRYPPAAPAGGCQH